MSASSTRRSRCRSSTRSRSSPSTTASPSAGGCSPFLKITRAMPLDPAKPMATRTLINAVKGGETLVIFPEGRLTVTGSLMKVYDGAGLIADKSDAMVVPVKIEGLERTPFSRLSREQVRRRWLPKVTVTMLEPVKLDDRSGAQGQQPPPGGGRGALRDHVRPRLPDHLDRSHRVRGRGRGGSDAMAGAGSRSRTRSPDRSPTSGCSSARTCSAASSCRSPTRARRSASCCRTRTAPP